MAEVSLEARVERLEQENRSLRLAVAGMKKVVRAEQFELVDTQGKTRATLAVSPDGGSCLALCDDKGEPLAGLNVLPDRGPLLTLHDDKGEVRAMLSLSSDDGPCLTLHDDKGEPRAGLSVFSDGRPRLALHVEARAESSLVLFDKEGKVMWKAPP